MSDLERAFVQAAMRTFDGLCFVVPDETPSVDNAPLPLEGGAWVRFEGPRCGAVGVWIRGHVLDALVSNMLGSNDAPSAQDRADGLCELANVLCGQLLPELAGEQATFDMRPPQILPDERVPANEKAPECARICLQVDGGQAVLALHLHGPKAGASA